MPPIGRYHNDHLGTPLALSNEVGEVVAEWVRDPFGTVIEKTGDVDDLDIFPGQIWDEDANLAYNWNRWYSPEIGRYTQVEPVLMGVKQQLGDFRNISKSLYFAAYFQNYAYAISNPLRYMDPDGLEWVETDIPLGDPFYVVICDCPEKSVSMGSLKVDGKRNAAGLVVPETVKGWCLDCDGKQLGYVTCEVSCRCF